MALPCSVLTTNESLLGARSESYVRALRRNEISVCEDRGFTRHVGQIPDAAHGPNCICSTVEHYAPLLCLPLAM